MPQEALIISCEMQISEHRNTLAICNKISREKNVRLKM